MINGVWSRYEFIRATAAQGLNRAGLRAIEEAIERAHRATTLQDRELRVQELVAAADDWLLGSRERLGRRGLSSPARPKVMLQVQQLKAQAEAALIALVRNGQQGFIHILSFRNALRSAADGPALEQVLRRLTRRQYEWLNANIILAELENKLTPEDAHWFAVFMAEFMLMPPDGSTHPLLRCSRPNKIRQEVIRCVSPMLVNKQIALGLLRARAHIVVVPRTRYMTDLPMFAHLKNVIVRGGGRVWNDTRGVGDISHGGCCYFACTEENLLGHELDTGVKRLSVERSDACPDNHVLDWNSPKGYYNVIPNALLPRFYDEGYSTTVHEFAHLIHRRVMSQADKELIEHHYKRWSRGMTEEDAAERTWTRPVLGAAQQAVRDKLHGEITARRISMLGERLLSGNLSTAEYEDLIELLTRHFLPRQRPVARQTLTMGWEWVDGPIGITEAEKGRREKLAERDKAMRKKIPSVVRQTDVTILGKTGKMTEVESVDMPRYMQSLPTAGSPCCYASSHVEEYFAQVTCCWFEANGGEDPYTHRPRKNSQEWVRQNEPRPIVELLERLFGSATIPNTNPRSAPL